jgi:hypothetical protein
MPIFLGRLCRSKIGPEPRCAADTAGAVVTWARSWLQTAVASVVPLVLSINLRRRLAVCCGGRQPTVAALSTPASGAADSYALARSSCSWPCL